MSLPRTASWSEQLADAVEDVKAIDWQWVSQGFVNGVSIYAVLPALQSILRKRRVDGATWRTAVACGAFLGGYRLLSQLLWKNKHLKRVTSHLSQRQRNFIAGAVGAGLGLSVDDHFLGSLLVIWWCLRAVRCVLPQDPRGLAPVAIMSAAASILAPAAFQHRDEHAKPYQKFMEMMAFHMDRPALLDQAHPDMRPSLHGWDKQVFCDNLNVSLGGHPTSSCLHSVGTFVAPRIFWISLKMYVPLYLAWAAFRLRVPAAKPFIENVMRSSIFLTGYTITQYLTIMWFTSTVSPNVTRFQHASMAWLSGLWTLVERKERRPELALYCMAQALNSLYLQAKKKGIVARTPRIVSYFLLIAASGTLAAFHDQHPKFVSTLFGFEKHLTYK